MAIKTISPTSAWADTPRSASRPLMRWGAAGGSAPLLNARQIQIGDLVLREIACG